MRRGKGFVLFAFAAGAVVVAVSVYGYTLLRKRPGLPGGIDRSAVVRMDGNEVRSSGDLDFLLSRTGAGRESRVVLRKGGNEETAAVRLIPYYSGLPYPGLFFASGLAVFLLGFLVLGLKSGDVRARIFFWMALAFAAAIAINGDFYCVRAGRAASLLPGLLFNFLYPLAPTLLLRFALTFDARFENKRLPWLYLPALAFGVGLNALFLAAVRSSSLEAARAQQRWTSAFRWYLVAVLGAAFVLFVRSYVKAGRAEDRASLKWVFYGLAVGLAPFILLYQVPRALGRAPLIPEELTTLLMILVPAAFALAVFKFRLMDVNLVINRSLVYSLLTVALVSLYLMALELLRGLFSRWGPARERWVAPAAAVLAAAAFHPARRSIQRLVDRAFFRRSFDFRACLASFGTAAQAMGRRENLAGLFRAAVDDALAVARTGVFLRGRKADSQEHLLQAGLDGPAFDRLKALDWRPGRPYGRAGGPAASASIDESRSAVLEEAGLGLVIPLSEPLSGFAAFGPKRSGQRLDGEDLELLLALTSELSVHLERVGLQDEVIYEQAVRRSLVELDRMKTEFIAAVSHELRTPLNSLQGLSEILSEGKARGADETNRLLGMMASECGRLSRFIHNVLDYGKIELEVKTYAKAPADLRRLVADAVGLFSPALEREGGRLNTRLPGRPVVLAVDADAVKQALLNILDNAVKYARPPKEIGVALEETPEEVRVEVADNGIGVAPADQARIFEGFTRTAEAVRVNPGGVGLGLKIVRHIMAAHGGAVGLESEPGRGSRLSLIFKRS